VTVKDILASSQASMVYSSARTVIITGGDMGLRELRKQRGLTLEAVAYLAGVDQATVSRLERGLVKPTPETTVRLARGLGISIARLRRLLADQPEPAEAAHVG
jgi:transcriptional regulator with XRE-family HTH domain